MANDLSKKYANLKIGPKFQQAAQTIPPPEIYIDLTEEDEIIEMITPPNQRKASIAKDRVIWPHFNPTFDEPDYDQRPATKRRRLENTAPGEKNYEEKIVEEKPNVQQLLRVEGEDISESTGFSEDFPDMTTDYWVEPMIIDWHEDDLYAWYYDWRTIYADENKKGSDQWIDFLIYLADKKPDLATWYHSHHQTEKEGLKTYCVMDLFLNANLDFEGQSYSDSDSDSEYIPDGDTPTSGSSTSSSS